MEETHEYWMWMKRKQNDPLMNSSSSLSSTTSWEDKAFAQDSSAARSLGEYIWPPRSYSCSFCMREFKSAQALGGHMNVHRRDRARLKQCLISPHSTTTTTTTTHEVSHQNHNPHHHSNISLHNYNLDPNCSFPPLVPSTFLSSNNSRVSAAMEKNKPFLYPFPPPPSSSSSSAAPCSDSKPGSERNSREEEDLIWLGDHDDDDDHVETDLCMGLNPIVGRNRRVGSCGESDYKRTKMDISPPLPFFIKHCNLHSEVIDELKVGSSMEDLDLELRLGDSPEVN